jgi:hypothetical protein
MVNGTVDEYIKKYPTVDHYALVCTSNLRNIWCDFDSLQIKGICEGVNVLHSMTPPIVHGDLKAVRSFYLHIEDLT